MNNKIKDARGVTLVEAAVSALILGITLVAMVGTFVIGRVNLVKTKHYTEAMNLLRYKMEEVKNTPYDDIATSPEENIIIDIGQDLTRGTPDDLSGTIIIDVSDKEDFDSDGNTSEQEIDINADGNNDSCKPVYITISWDELTMGSSNQLSLEMATIVGK